VDFGFDFSRSVASRKSGSYDEGANSFVVVLHSLLLLVSIALNPQTKPLEFSERYFGVSIPHTN